MTAPLPTVQFASLVYGDGVALDDPAERFHEAAKLYPSTAGRQMVGVHRLAIDAVLRCSIERAGHRLEHLPGQALPPPAWPAMPIGAALRARQSRPPAPGSSLDVSELAAILAAGAGCSGRERRRHVPSAGALYPLELYVLATRVRDLQEGVHHFDPYANRLERLGSLPPELASCLVDPSLASRAAALVVVTAVFWRTRVKYGPRGYRFALLEAGHAVQNALLVATALELAALPVGGYYDARVESLLGIDGVDESALYVLALGHA